MRIEADHLLDALVFVHVSVERMQLFVERFGALRIAAGLRFQSGEFAVVGEFDLLERRNESKVASGDLTLLYFDTNLQNKVVLILPNIAQ